MAGSFDGVKSLSRDSVTSFFRLLLFELPTPRNQELRSCKSAGLKLAEIQDLAI